MSDWLQIDEEGEVDVEEIMRQIKAHIAQRKVAREEGGDWSTLPRLEGRFSRAVYDELAQAMRENDRVYAALLLTPSRLPVVGRMVDALRRKAHGLVIFYVNQVVDRQVAFNHHIIRAFTALLEDLERDDVAGADALARQGKEEPLGEEPDSPGAP